MRDEINKLLKEERIIKEDLTDKSIHNFYNKIIEIGSNSNTKNIKKEEITKDLNTEFIGKKIYIYKEVLSTNTLAKFFAEHEVENGTLIISEKQVKGRGRNGRYIHSPCGGVWLSLILKPSLELNEVPLITLATGVAVAKTLEKLGINGVRIKWPNDILISGKKASGVLTESIAKLNLVEYIILGVGIDVNIKKEELPQIRYETTSLMIEKGEEIDENLVIKRFLEEFEVVYKIFMKKNHEKILTSWRERSYTVGKFVKINGPLGRIYEGYAVGVNKEGHLIIEKGDGSFEKIMSGEV